MYNFTHTRDLNVGCVRADDRSAVTDYTHTCTHSFKFTKVGLIPLYIAFATVAELYSCIAP